MSRKKVSLKCPTFSKSKLYISMMGVMLSSAALAQEVQENAATLPTIALSATHEEVAYKSGNMDIPRTEDDAQAYTFIDREEFRKNMIIKIVGE